MIDNLHELLLDPISLDEVSVSELEDLITEFPAVGVFKVLLAKKMNRPDEANLVNQVNDPVMMALYMDEARIAGSATSTFTSEANQVVPLSDDLVVVGDVADLEVINDEIEEVEAAQVIDILQSEANIIDNFTNIEIEEEKELEAEIETNIQPIELAHQTLILEADDKTLILEAEDLNFKSEKITSKKPKSSKSKKRKSSETKAKDLVGLSSYGQWLLTFKDKEIASKIEKAKKKAEKKKKEDKIKENAKLSVTKSNEIISEPLANILAAQGHLDQAKKMFEQLIVRNPEKSSYFAAQINNLIKFSDK